MDSSIIIRNNNSIHKPVTFVDVLYGLCKVSCIALIIYYCWYVEAFGNLSIVVNGSFLLLSSCVILIHFINFEISLKDIPYGIWNQVVMICYSFLTGFVIAYNQIALINALKHFMIFFMISYGIVIVSNYYESYKWVFTWITIAVLICSFHLMFYGYHYSSNRIVLSSNSNPNILATILNLGMFCVLYRTSFNFKSLAISIPIVCIIMYNVIMTGSRKGFIESLMLISFWGLFLFAQVCKNGNRKELIVILVLLLCISLIFIYFYITFIKNTEVIARMETMGNEDSNSARIEMYKEAFDIFVNKPIFGGGLDQYQYWSARGGYSHSTYAEAIADFGIVGCILYFLPFILTGYQLLILSKNSEYVFHALFLFGFCIVELFLGAVQIWFFEAGHILSWTIVFLVTNMIKNSENKDLSDNTLSKRYKYVKY